MHDSQVFVELLGTAQKRGREMCADGSYHSSEHEHELKCPVCRCEVEHLPSRIFSPR